MEKIEGNCLSTTDFINLFLGMLKYKGYIRFKPRNLELFIINCKKYDIYQDLVAAFEVDSSSNNDFLTNFESEIEDAIANGYLAVNEDGIATIQESLNPNIIMSKYDNFKNHMIGFLKGLNFGTSGTECLSGIAPSYATNYTELYFGYAYYSKLNSGEKERLEKSRKQFPLSDKIKIYNALKEKFDSGSQEVSEELIERYINCLENQDLNLYLIAKCSYDNIEMEIENICRSIIFHMGSITKCDHTFIREGNNLICVSCGPQYNEYDNKIKELICLCAEASQHVVKSATLEDIDFLRRLVKKCLGHSSNDFGGIETTPDLINYYNQEVKKEHLRREMKERKKVRKLAEHPSYSEGNKTNY